MLLLANRKTMIRELMRKAQGRKPVTIHKIKGYRNKITIKFSDKVVIKQPFVIAKNEKR
jgi:hypothetical protein